MIDFHTHILPRVDDGSDSSKTSIEMLRESRKQGVTLMCATPHFYAYEDSMTSFLERRMASWERLSTVMAESGEEFPKICLGSEVLYFPGMSEATELETLTIENTRCLLVEPPMDKWTTAMFDEIERTGQNLRVIPVIAHLDRYISIFNAPELAEKVRKRRVLFQVNASFFLYENSQLAIRLLKEGKLTLIGSDCHNMTDRKPNLIYARKVIHDAGLDNEFRKMEARSLNIFDIR